MAKARGLRGVFGQKTMSSISTAREILGAEQDEGIDEVATRRMAERSKARHALKRIAEEARALCDPLGNHDVATCECMRCTAKRGLGET